ncbi:hypothetical protein EON66_02730 [archaeon]|nr:MAG: hypothetical protein EON66_02730 [archaeon]
MLKLLVVGLFGHLGFAVWMLGSTHIFMMETFDIPSLTNIASSLNLNLTTRVRQAAVIPFLILLIAVFGVLLLNFALRCCTATVSRVAYCFSCGHLRLNTSFEREMKRRLRDIRADFSVARSDGTMQGLTTYNVLLNPRFTSAFAISRAFGQAHRRVADISQDAVMESATM